MNGLKLSVIKNTQSRRLKQVTSLHCPAKPKDDYLRTCKVIRYCLSALHGDTSEIDGDSEMDSILSQFPRLKIGRVLKLQSNKHDKMIHI